MSNEHKKVTLRRFAEFCHELVKSDRDNNIGVGGFTGEGKSTFAIQLLKEYELVKSGKEWDFNQITWMRKEMLKWIDGEGDKREGRLPEYSGVLVDELVSLFYKRNWYEDSQKESIELFNKCRDRHLLIVGNIPDFWDLDSGFLSRIRFYVYIPKRGTAWVFEQENNPFIKDKWNYRDNLKAFRQYKNPFKCQNFLFEILYDDLSPDDKDKYLEIRNTKRLGTEGQNEKVEKYREIKAQRNKVIRLLFERNPDIKDIEVAKLLGCAHSLISGIRTGVVI